MGSSKRWRRPRLTTANPDDQRLQRAGRVSRSSRRSPKEKVTPMDGKILNSEGQYVADIRLNEIYDLSGKKLYHLRGQKIYKPTGELVGHLNSVGSDRRLDKSTDRLFPKTRQAQCGNRAPWHSRNRARWYRDCRRRSDRHTQTPRRSKGGRLWLAAPQAPSAPT